MSHDTLKKYFPKSYTAKQMENVIIRLLDSWLKKRLRSIRTNPLLWYWIKV